MDNNNSDHQPETKKAPKAMWFWLLISSIFFILSVFLILAVYKLVVNTNENLASPLRSLSIYLSQQKEKKVQPDDNLVRRYIDGVLVEPGKENIFPMAVVIDNHPDSHPLVGLAQANLVYEAEVEGVTTRYLAIFADDQELDNIGPVRSARPYFADWSRELSALFVHCGGSPEALVKIIKDNIFDLNEFYNGKYFWRADNRPAPHNVFTSSKNLREYTDDKNLTEGKYFSWNYKDDTLLMQSTSSKIIIPEFGVIWEYDKGENNYVRYLGKEKQRGNEREEIKAKNIIVAFMAVTVIDEELRLKIENIGIGQAIVCLDGACQESEWRKKSATSRTRFYNSSGEEFIFNAGPTWIEVVRPGYEVSY